ncbi:MAG: DUF2158 domain-containing protein [Nitrospirae bacterium]|nr:DUF2158 domain-containing protein [Nitrospirota bacterium]
MKVGDLVVLKSGGPPMTVENVGSDNIKCVWFAGDEEKFAYFAPDTLKPWEAPREESSVKVDLSEVKSPEE